MKQFKHLSNEEIDTADEILRKGEYELRLKEESKYLEEQEQILNLVLDKDELKQAKIEAEEISKYYVYDVWKRLFNKVSFYNEVPCQVLLHVLIGQLLGKKKILQTYDFIDMRIHMIWIQDPGTGKGTAFSFLNRLSRRLKNYDGGDIRFYSSGVETTAAMIDSLVYDDRRRRYSNQVRPGILSSNDIICWEEAVSLFRPVGENNEGKVRAILDVCEPYGSPNNIHTKALLSWPVPTHTTSSASLIATSRPIPNLRGEVLYSGLFQRFLTYIRKVDHELSDKMNEATSLNSFGEGGKQFVGEENKLVKELLEIQKFGKETELEPYPKDKILKLINEKMKILSNDCWNQVGNEEDINIIQSFIRRMRNNLVKLACHSAIMRRSKYIEMSDVEYGFELILKLYNSLKVWVELDIAEEVDKVYQLRIKSILDLIRKEGREGRLLRRKDLAGLVSKMIRKSIQSAYTLIKRMSQGDNSYIYFDELGYVHVR